LNGEVEGRSRPWCSSHEELPGQRQFPESHLVVLPCDSMNRSFAVRREPIHGYWLQKLSQIRELLCGHSAGVMKMYRGRAFSSELSHRGEISHDKAMGEPMTLTFWRTLHPQLLHCRYTLPPHLTATLRNSMDEGRGGCFLPSAWGAEQNAMESG